MILPIIKREVKTGEFCRIPEKITYSYDADVSEACLGAEAFGGFTAGAVYVAEGGFVIFSFDSALEDRAEIYRVTVSASGIKVCFKDARGAVNGAVTAALLLRKETLEECEIVDYPSCEYRSVMLDMARGLPTWEDIEYAVKYMALSKFNRLHLHLIDSMGPCYISEAVPEYVFTGKGGQCDKDFLRRIDKLCESYAIEIIPEIEVPAHGNALCEAHPEFKCDVENAHSWTICPGADGVLEFFEKLIGEVAQLFPRSEYIHIGTDELEFRDLKHPRLCHWDDCPRCAALREREGLADRQEEFYYLINKMHEIVKSFGKKMMMWSDQIDVSREEANVSREILMEFWRVAGRGRGPHDGCSFEKLLEKGFNVINAYYPCTYFDVESYTSAEKLKTWTPFTEPEHSDKYSSQIIGGEACAWEYGNYDAYPFYSYVTPFVIALFGDKLWGLGEREHDDAYASALSEMVFGDASYVDFFEHIGGLIPPRSKDKLTYRTSEELSEDALCKCISRLEANITSPAAERCADLLKAILARLG